MPARTLSTWSGHQRGGWHAAAHELAVLVVVELEYCRQQFFIRSRRTSLSQDIYHDWTVAMAWSGAESLKGWYVDDNDKVARINKRAQAFRRRVQRFATRHGFGREVEGSSFAEDLYYAAVATLVDDGVVSMWVRRRDIRGRSKAQAAEWGFASGSDMYWMEKLAVGFLGPYFGATDVHSGLPVEKQLEVLRRVRFAGPDAAPQPKWSVHRNLEALQTVVDVATQSGYYRGRAAQVWIVVMVQIACGQMTTDDAILPDTRLLELVQGSDSLPEEAEGLSPEQYEVLGELREGARMHRDWPSREGRETTPTLSKYRDITPEITLEWKLKARWKTFTFDTTERELAVRSIGFRAEQPLNSAAYKDAVLPTIVSEVDDENAGRPYHMYSCGCLNGRFELKATDEYTDCDEADTVPSLVCSEWHKGDVVRDSCCGYLPPFGDRGDAAHGCDVAAFRPRPNRESENLHYVGEHAEIGLMIAHHARATAQQRARMVNVDVCAGSQSQRKAMLLLNVLTVSFDNRPSVDTAGTIMTNVEVDATLDLYDAVATVLHSRGIAMSRVAMVTLSSDCKTTGTVTAKHYRYRSGKPRPTKKGAEAAAADMVMRRTLELVKRLRRERVALAQNQ